MSVNAERNCEKEGPVRLQYPPHVANGNKKIVISLLPMCIITRNQRVVATNKLQRRNTYPSAKSGYFPEPG
jgi:hypothetical protein